MTALNRIQSAFRSDLVCSLNLCLDMKRHDYRQAASHVAFVDARISTEAVVAVQAQRCLEQRESKTAIRTFHLGPNGLNASLF